jgi:CheY-like chemotaxis protein
LLVVDDHRGVLERVAAVLASDFDVAGVATGGRQAVAMAGRLAPDAVVLDINMPGFDGYQTKSALDEAGTRVPVVFLSMFESDEYVSEAFRCGGRGYVLKPYLGRDLASAVHHVLRGQLFVPSLVSLFHLTDGGGDAMQLYDEPGSFLDGLAGFFDLALRRGDATCVIATRDLRDGLSDRLRARGWDTSDASHRHGYFVDATDALGRFMRDGLPDPARLTEIASELDRYRLAVGDGTASRLTLFGNMADLLLGAGNPTAAIALERLWTSLTHALPFFTVCGYSAASGFADAARIWSQACAEHWAVSHATGS